MSASSSKFNGHYLFGAIMLLLFLMPFWMGLFWYLTPKRKMVVAIVDKTVLNNEGQEHISLNWVLMQEKFTKANNDLYKQSRDYYGFFPQKDKQFELKGLERFDAAQLNQLSEDVDLAYFTDAYGVYKNEWYGQSDEKERSGMLYGGMGEQDFEFLKMMKEKKKLIITEFNCLASPTSSLVRTKFEQLFGISWSGWIGRYFDSFDSTLNKELPKWLVRNYRLQNKGNWPFKKSGIAFVHSDGKIIILENEVDLLYEFPEMISNKEGQEKYKLPVKIPYNFWFDIIEPDANFNHVIANFTIQTNDRGTKILEKNGLPNHFPAITLHLREDYQFFYFSADFSDNPISIKSAYLKGMPLFKTFMYNNRERMGRKAFFWEVYQPLVSTILNNYYHSKLQPQFLE